MPIRSLVGLSLLAVGWYAAGSDEVSPTTKSEATSRQTLERFNPLVGAWRGVGQVRRGSRSGAWQETTTVEWAFNSQHPAILFKADGGKHFEQLRISVAADGRLVAKQTLKEQVVVYHGDVPSEWPNRIQLVSDPDGKGVTFRCTLQQLNDKRATLLLEKRTQPTGSFRRIAGVGYTRKGERLAEVGGTSRKCIVTGGLGTIAVSHEGKTYYVCCQGCVQAFNDAPDEIIAEYKRSLDQD